MTLSTTASSVTYQGNGATTSFPYGFYIASADHVSVILTDTTVSPANVITLAKNQYTISGIGNRAGGSVVCNDPGSGAPIPLGKTLTIRRVVPYRQDTAIPNQGGFYPDVLEGALDYLTMAIQQLAEQMSRSVQVPVGSGADPASYLSVIQAAQTAAQAAAVAAQAAQTAAAGSQTAAAGSQAAAGASASAAAADLAVVEGYANGSTQWPAPKISTNSVFQDSADATKQMSLSLAGVSPGQTRVLTVPNANTVLVGRDTVDTLTNKTLASPTISGAVTGLTSLIGANSNNSPYLGSSNLSTAFYVYAGAGAVNGAVLAASASGNMPYFQTQGSDPNISLAFKAKGNGGFNFWAGDAGALFSVGYTAGAVNYLQAVGGSAGNKAFMSAQGTDANIACGLYSKGSYQVELGTSNLNSAFMVYAGAGAVNGLQLVASSTGSAPLFQAQGSDPNIGITYITKGTFGHTFGIGSRGTAFQIADAGGTAVNNIVAQGSTTGQFVQFYVNGTDPNVDFAISPKGTGNFRINKAATAASVAANFVATHYIPFNLNGTVYYVPLKTAAW